MVVVLLMIALSLMTVIKIMFHDYYYLELFGILKMATSTSSKIDETSSFSSSPSQTPLTLGNTTTTTSSPSLGSINISSSVSYDLSSKTESRRQHQPSRRTYFGNDTNVVVLQIGNKPFRARMSNHTIRNEQWAKCMSYQYKFEELVSYYDKSNNNACVYTQKVQRIYQNLIELPNFGDWLIFVDMDAQYQAKKCTALDTILPTQSKIQSQKCEIIALTSPQTINTGIVIIQKTYSTLSIIKRWYEKQMYFETVFGRSLACYGPADQIAFQEVVMEEYLLHPEEEKEEEDDEDVRNLRDTDDPASFINGTVCRGLRRPTQLCFAKHMKEHQRSIRNLCLMGCEDYIPNLQCKDCYEGNRHQCSNTPAANEEEEEDQRPIFLHEKYAPVSKLPPPI